MQSSFFSSNGVHRFSHGGLLRQQKRGRGERALSTKEPLHAVFKIERLRLRQKSLRAPQSFKLVLNIIEKFAKHFAGQIAQSFEKEGLLAAALMTHTPPVRASQD